MAEGLLKPALQCHSTSIKPGWRPGNSGAHGVMEYSNSQNIWVGAVLYKRFPQNVSFIWRLFGPGWD